MYWEPLFDWKKIDEVIMNLGASATDGDVMLSMLKAALQGNGEQVIMIGQKHTDACLGRPSCKMLYIRAAFALDRIEIIRNLTIDDNIWRALAGKDAPLVETEEELSSYQLYYETLLSLFPGKPDLHKNLGSINRTMGHWNEALPYFEQALILDPDNSRYRCNLGEALQYTNEDPDRGLALCLEAIQQSPDDLWLYEKAGRLSARNGHCDEALKIYKEAIIRFPERLEPQQWLTSLKSEYYGQCR